jgi:hypothetical protein
MAQTFEQFVRDWMSHRIVAVGSDMDADDRDYMVRRRADELRELARQRDFEAELAEAAQPYGGVSNYVRQMYKDIEESRRSPDTELQ